MKLVEFEAQSALWQKVSQEIDKRLQSLRLKNDGNLDVQETAKLRGQIAAYKEILSWAEPDPKFNAD